MRDREGLGPLLIDIQVQLTNSLRTLQMAFISTKLVKYVTDFCALAQSVKAGALAPPKYQIYHLEGSGFVPDDGAKERLFQYDKTTKAFHFHYPHNPKDQPLVSFSQTMRSARPNTYKTTVITATIGRS